MSDDIFSQLSPEQLQQLMHLGTLNQRSDLLQQQMQQALALRKPSGEKHVTGFGAAVGGLADIGNSVIGQLRENKAREALDQNITEQEQGRTTLANVWAKMQAQQAAAEQQAQAQRAQYQQDLLNTPDVQFVAPYKLR
jgi:hypothetical protein